MAIHAWVSSEELQAIKIMLINVHSAFFHFSASYMTTLLQLGVYIFWHYFPFLGNYHKAFSNQSRPQIMLFKK